MYSSACICVSKCLNCIADASILLMSKSKCVLPFEVFRYREGNEIKYWKIKNTSVVNIFLYLGQNIYNVGNRDVKQVTENNSTSNIVTQFFLLK